ncbi:unnamed protein product, partial [Amoebophrya sp. A120]
CGAVSAETFFQQPRDVNMAISSISPQKKMQLKGRGSGESSNGSETSLSVQVK